MASAVRQKDEFLALLGHELRNPLAPVRNALQVMRLQRLDPAVEPLRAMMDRQITNLTRVIDGLLDMEKIASGRIVVDAQPQPLMPLLEQALDANAGYAHTHGMAFELDPIGSVSVRFR